MRVLSFVLAVAVAPVARGADAAWLDESTLPQGVAGHAAAIRGAVVWTVGGSRWDAGSKRVGDAVLRRSAGESNWTQVASIPKGFAHGGWADDGRALWLAGGLDVHGASGAVWRLDLDCAVVERVGELGEPVAYCGAAVLDGALWVVGGTPVDGDFTRASVRVWRVDLATRVIEVLPGAGPASINPVVVALQGQLHVLPGSEWSAGRRQLEAPGRVWIFSPKTRRWTQRPLSRIVPRGLTGTALDEDRALLAGGAERRDGETVISSGVWIYDARDGSLAAQTALPAPRLASAMIRRGADILFLGGEDAPRQRAATIWRWRSAP